MDGPSVMQLFSHFQDQNAGKDDNRVPMPSSKIPTVTQTLQRFQKYFPNMGKHEKENADVQRIESYGRRSGEHELYVSTRNIGF